MKDAPGSLFERPEQPEIDTTDDPLRDVQAGGNKNCCKREVVLGENP